MKSVSMAAGSDSHMEAMRGWHEICQSIAVAGLHRTENHPRFAALRLAAAMLVQFLGAMT
jgi:hypothetical protein